MKSSHSICVIYHLSITIAMFNYKYRSLRRMYCFIRKSQMESSYKGKRGFRYKTLRGFQAITLNYQAVNAQRSVPCYSVNVCLYSASVLLSFCVVYIIFSNAVLRITKKFYFLQSSYSCLLVKRFAFGVPTGFTVLEMIYVIMFKMTLLSISRRENGTE